MQAPFRQICYLRYMTKNTSSSKTKSPISFSRSNKASTSLVLDSPHCGTDYPKDFGYSCDKADLRQCEDTYIGALFEPAAKKFDAAFLKANFPRSYIDVNRALTAIDPRKIRGGWQYPTDIDKKYTKRGHGLIWRKLRDGGAIYNRQLTTDEVKSRIKYYYKPYHNTLSELIDETHKKHGEVWHLNCHSMGSDAPFPKRGRNPDLADFVLGDRNGTSCDKEFTNFVAKTLKDMGYKVAINDPFSGVELTKKYSNPSDNRHSLQIEIRRDLYMCEKTRIPNQNYNNLQKDVSKLVEAVSAYIQKNTPTPPKP